MVRTLCSAGILRSSYISILPSLPFSRHLYIYTPHAHERSHIAVSFSTRMRFPYFKDGSQTGAAVFALTPTYIFTHMAYQILLMHEKICLFPFSSLTLFVGGCCHILACCDLILDLKLFWSHWSEPCP